MKGKFTLKGGNFVADAHPFGWLSDTQLNILQTPHKNKPSDWKMKIQEQ